MALGLLCSKGSVGCPLCNMSIIPERNALHVFFRVAVGLLSLALVYATAIPLVRSDTWWVRVFDFPRVQIAALLALTLAGYAALRLCGQLRLGEYALAAVVGLSLVWQLISIVPYTALYPREMSDSRTDDDSNRISLLIYNVLHDNREVAALRDLIRDNEPDIILLSETTQWWLERLDGLEDGYPHTLFQPQENDYGLLLYSRLEPENSEIRFLVDPEVPSIRTQVGLRSGTVVTLYGVHPRPPGLRPPGKEKDSGIDEDVEGEREDSDMREAELLSVAKEIKELGDVPAIVAGDLNNVAWSYTKRLFKRIGGLLDPRVGRGIINTLSTRSRLLRFPLDYVFATSVPTTFPCSWSSTTIPAPAAQPKNPIRTQRSLMTDNRASSGAGRLHSIMSMFASWTMHRFSIMTDIFPSKSTG